MVVTDYFSNPISAKQNGDFANTVQDQKVDCYVGMVSSDSNPTINFVQRDMFESTVYVTSKVKSGEGIQYKIKMTRDVLG